MSIARQRMDFDVKEFNRFLVEKGYDLIHQKMILCSCKLDDGQNITSCEYCNGTGYRYLEDGKRIKAIMTSINKDTSATESGIYSTGLVNITTLASSRLGFLDKLTLTDGKFIYNEVISNTNKIPKLRYTVLDVESVVGLHKIYVKEVDYNIINGAFTWLKPILEAYSIRYITYPVFIVLNFPNIIRGTTLKWKTPNLVYAELPVRATAKLEFKMTDGDYQI